MDKAEFFRLSAEQREEKPGNCYLHILFAFL